MQRFPLFKSSLFSRLFGCFASKAFPALYQSFINRGYIKLMKVDLSEFQKPEEYPTLNALFTRKLLTPRSFDESASSFISPCDSFISAAGAIEDSTALQIKGHRYSISTLLSDYCSFGNKQKLEGGYYLNFYLSPKDYHRYHAPIDMKVTQAIHIPGKLYPVNFKWLRKIEGLFCENERVILECYTACGKLFYMVFVGALNVGKMQFCFDERIQTNAKATLQQFYIYDELEIQKGDELGRFEMGSTIVMLFEKESFTLCAEHNAPIRFGQTIGTN